MGIGKGKGKKEKENKESKKSESKSKSKDSKDRKIPADYFVSVKLIIYLVFIVFFVFCGLCVSSPESFVELPLVAMIGTFGFWTLLLVNLVFTMLTIKVCKDNAMGIKTTVKWIGQTVITGFFSYKLIKSGGQN